MKYSGFWFIIVFGYRTFIYYYRIVDKHLDEGIKVMSLAVLTDKDEDYRPNSHHDKLWGFGLNMTFPIVKIIDYRDKEELKKKLETSSNPMAMVVKAQLRCLDIKKADDQYKAKVKLELIRLCVKQWYRWEQIDGLMKFLYWIILLPEEYNEHIRETLEEEDKTMSELMTHWEVNAEKRGVNNEKIKTAGMMLADGLDMDFISKYTGLSLDELKKLGVKKKDN